MGIFPFRGLFDLMVYPLVNIQMWKPDLWDINYFMWISVAILSQYLYKEYINKWSGKFYQIDFNLFY